MRYPEGHKETVRAAIVKHAARALRREGIDGVSIPALMKKAGLTHGGFYSHFKNRDHLVAEAVRFAAAETGASVLAPESGDLRATLDAYLSKEHTEHPERGCVLAALGGEGRRQASPVRRAFAEAARGFVRLVGAKVDGGCAASGRPSVGDPSVLSEDALRVAAQMVGAVVLARLVDDRELAARILGAAKVV